MKRKAVYGGYGQTPKKKRRISSYRPSVAVVNRRGYGSVARARGAAVSGEMKYFDCDNNTTNLAAVTTTWVAATLVNPLTTINLGDPAIVTPNCLFAPKVSAALNGRIGRKVKVMKIKVRGQIICPPQTGQAAADISCKVRILLVMDKQTNAAAMASANLLQDASGSNATIATFQNPNNFGRFQVLKDKTMDFGNVSMAGSSVGVAIDQAGLVRSFKFTRKFRVPVTVNFNATNGGTVADIIDNSFHLIAAANNISYAPQISYYSRVSYKE